MAINKKLIHFKNKQKFNEELANGNILETSIVFIQDTQEIYTHSTFYDGKQVDLSNIETSIQNILNNKQDNISDLEAIRSGAALGATSIQPSDLANIAKTGSYDDLINKPTIPTAVTESTVSGWGFTKNTGTYSKPSTGIPKNDLASAVQTSLGKADTALQSYTEQYKGTITGVSANGTSVATSGVANIPAASTSAYGVTKLSSSTSSTSTTLAATASAVKSAYDLANGKQAKLVSGTNIKTINGESILGSGDIMIEGGSSCIKFTNKTASAWVSDSTYDNFKYKCDIACDGVTADMYAEVVFAMEQAVSGNYSPVCETGNGIVTIWSSVTDSITIPTIIITK